jgi:uncharacterized protein YceK
MIRIANLWIIAATVALLCGCSSLQSMMQPSAGPCNLQKPGTYAVKSAEQTSSEYDCKFGGEPRLVIVGSTLEPATIKKGGEMCHRVTYAFCPSKQGETMPIKVERMILYKGKNAGTIPSTMELAHGTWNKDVSMPVPADALDGLYALWTVIYVGGKSYETTSNFTVVP